MRKFTSAERTTLFKEARLVHRQPELDIRLLKKNTEASLPGRLLVITPKKVGSAPQRNLIRRRLKSLFYEEGLYKIPADLLIYCKKGSTDLSFAKLKNILHHVYQENS